ncbi:OmpA family protein [Thalassobius sp. MITS945101]|uniref:OmpA family protein n=1 Tax=Thalassobius sp. MITS945101 TaxID=3096994 RepID=UPI003999FC0D
MRRIRSFFMGFGAALASGLAWIAIGTLTVVGSPAVASSAVALPQALCLQLMDRYGIVGDGCLVAQVQQTQLSPVAQNPEVSHERRDVAGQAQRQTSMMAEAALRESHVFFPAGGLDLDPVAQAQIALLGDILNIPVMARACLHLVGHSDSSGSTTQNLRLSKQRAEVVADHLRPLLDDGRRIRSLEGKGEEEPLAGVDSRDPRNRRVAIWARSCAADPGYQQGVSGF